MSPPLRPFFVFLTHSTSARAGATAPIASAKPTNSPIPLFMLIPLSKADGKKAGSIRDDHLLSREEVPDAAAGTGLNEPGPLYAAVRSRGAGRRRVMVRKDRPWPRRTGVRSRGTRTRLRRRGRPGQLDPREEEPDLRARRVWPIG